jgi:hypothetical protein
VPIIDETTASLVITVEGKEVVKGWREEGCWERKRRWRAEPKEGVARPDGWEGKVEGLETEAELDAIRRRVLWGRRYCGIAWRNVQSNGDWSRHCTLAGALGRLLQGKPINTSCPVYAAVPWPVAGRATITYP